MNRHGMRDERSTRARLHATQAWLHAIARTHAALCGATAGAGVLVARAIVGSASPWWWLAAGIVGVGAAALALWRAAPGGVTAERAALWVEARVPALRYALVTLASDDARVPAAAERTLDAAVRSVRWDDALRRSAVRAVTPPALAFGAVALLAAFAPQLSFGVLSAVNGAPLGARPTRAVLDRLARVRATVTPPAYAGLDTRRMEDPSAIDALVGSTIVVDGIGGAEGLTSSIATDSGAVVSPRVAAHGDGWRVALTMPARPAALRLSDGARTRIVVLAPRPDASPRVALSLPSRDTVLRTPTGALPLAASADDDLGLASGQFEWIVSSGEGESFKFRNGVLGRTALSGAHGALRAALSIEGLGLRPGDLVHLRAVARDRDPSASHAHGTSETRTIRVARAGEYDSVAVDAAPPALGDTSQLGQRMLLMLTEALVQRQRALQRPALLAESQKIAQDQGRLRRRVGDLVFARLGENKGEETQAESEKRAGMTPEELLAAASAATGADLSQPLEGREEETPIVAVNRPMLEAYNHMWDAGRALEIGEPAKAIPPMRKAIIALQKARAAERIYLRGKAPTAVIDIAKVRLAARPAADTMHPAPRTSRAPLDAKARARLASLARAAELAVRDAAAAADTLALLRVDALADSPALAAASGEAADALRAGRDATAAFVRARRIAAGASARVDSLGGWAW